VTAGIHQINVSATWTGAPYRVPSKLSSVLTKSLSDKPPWAYAACKAAKTNLSSTSIEGREDQVSGGMDYRSFFWGGIFSKGGTSSRVSSGPFGGRYIISKEDNIWLVDSWY